MRQGAQGWCTGMTQRDGIGREVGRKIRMGNTCISMVDSYQCMAKPVQYYTVISLQLKEKKNKVRLSGFLPEGSITMPVTENKIISK